jgi:hypothetical protein
MSTRRASASCLSSKWNDDHVLANGAVVGQISRPTRRRSVTLGVTLAFEHHADEGKRTQPTVQDANGSKRTTQMRRQRRGRQRRTGVESVSSQSRA